MLAEAAARYIAGGMTPKDAHRRPAAEHGVGRRAVAAAIDASEAAEAARLAPPDPDLPA